MSEKYLPGFTSVIQPHRDLKRALVVISDMGDIQKKEKFVYRKTCDQKHPGICALDDRGHVSKLEEIAAALFERMRRGRNYNLVSTKHVGRRVSPVFSMNVRAVHLREREPKILVAAELKSVMGGPRDPLTLELVIRRRLVKFWTCSHLAKKLWPTSQRKSTIHIKVGDFECSPRTDNYLRWLVKNKEAATELNLNPPKVRKVSKTTKKVLTDVDEQMERVLQALDKAMAHKFGPLIKTQEIAKARKPRNSTASAPSKASAAKRPSATSTSAIAVSAKVIGLKI